MSGIARAASREHRGQRRCAARPAGPARRAWRAAPRRRRVLPGRSRTRSPARRRARRPGTGCASAPTLRTSRTPTPAGPPHLCAEAAAAAQPSGSGRRPAEAQASTNSGASVEAATSATGWHTPTSGLADWSGDHGRLAVVAGRGGDRVGVDPPVPVDGERLEGRRLWPRARRRRGAPPSARRRRRAAGRPWRARPASRPSTPRWQACVPLGVKVTSSGRTPRHSATTARALSSISRGSRAGRCRRRGSAYPRVEGLEQHLACRRVQRRAGRVIEVRRNRGVRNRRPAGPKRRRSQGKTYRRPARRSGGPSVVGFR